MIYNAVIFYMAAFFVPKKGQTFACPLNFYSLLIIRKSVVDSRNKSLDGRYDDI